jgi:NTE family protein
VATKTKTVDLALQGGGAHGAFTWGVLDRLLEDERIEIRGLSGTSAGAMNAVILTHGLLTGGRGAAQQELWSFWKAVSRSARANIFNHSAYELFFGGWLRLYSPTFVIFDFFSRLLSPYQFNPLNLNPVKEILEQTVDFKKIRETDRIRIFVAATNVHTGRLRVFRNRDITADAVMASACLPLLFQAVEIEGEAYWDGGYTGNPAILPLIAESTPRDLVLVTINPSFRRDIPRVPREILNRLNEITFNNSLIKEMRAVTILKQLLEVEKTPPRKFEQALFDQVARMHAHRIHAEEELGELDVTSKLDPQWQFLIHLHGIGRRAASQWIDVNFEALGRRSTIDLAESFL